MSAGPACRHFSQKEIDEYYSDRQKNQFHGRAQEREVDRVKEFIDMVIKDRPEKCISFYRGVPLTEDNFTFQDLLNILSIEVGKRERYGV